MRPPYLSAPGLRPSRWSLTTAVRQRRGRRCCALDKAICLLYFHFVMEVAQVVYYKDFCSFLFYSALLFLSFSDRYDYLEFTDARGGKVRYDMKVGTEKWPKVRSWTTCGAAMHIFKKKLDFVCVCAFGTLKHYANRKET